MTAIPPHNHCIICGKAIPAGEKFCSEKCKQEYERMVKRRKLYVYLMYLALALLLIMLFVSYR
ncbi:MAG: DUF2116 family Zn-ribbon domain-containing protein [Thermoplasmata archaeon]|nr:MAG: DUF2116 family Zn-ribbon domain-containing protein [Thermoplasmata archaeon]